MQLNEDEAVEVAVSQTKLQKNNGAWRHGGSLGNTRAGRALFKKPFSYTSETFALLSPPPLSKDGFRGSFKNKQKELIYGRLLG